MMLVPSVSSPRTIKTSRLTPREHAGLINGAMLYDRHEMRPPSALLAAPVAPSPLRRP